MGTGVSTRARSQASRSQPALTIRAGKLDHVNEGCESASLLRVAQLGRAKDGAATRSAVSTGPLSVSPHVHVRPIDPVVFREPSSCEGRPDLGGSFALICLQRLSVPYVATQRCR